jgi:ankyrin repeat protein
LLKAGVNPNSAPVDGNTALHYAVRNRSAAIVKALLAHADPSIQNADGASPLHRALFGRLASPEILESLVTANASMFIQDAFGKTPFEMAAGLNCTEINKIFTDRLLSAPSFDSHYNELGVSSRLIIKSPLTLTNNHSLCDVLVSSVDEFYSLLNNFENSGFALGFDILRAELVLAEPLDIQFFTGIYQIRSKLISF